jgi:hypothetical protein
LVEFKQRLRSCEQFGNLATHVDESTGTMSRRETKMLEINGRKQRAMSSFNESIPWEFNITGCYLL